VLPRYGVVPGHEHKACMYLYSMFPTNKSSSPLYFVFSFSLHTLVLAFFHFGFPPVDNSVSSSTHCGFPRNTRPVASPLPTFLLVFYLYFYLLPSTPIPPLHSPLNITFFLSNFHMSGLLTDSVHQSFLSAMSSSTTRPILLPPPTLIIRFTPRSPSSPRIRFNFPTRCRE
jgi:hypothetical protein